MRPSLALAAALLVAQPVRGQTTLPPTSVRVRVVDSAGTPLSGADVSIVRGLASPLASGNTSASGEITLNIPQGTEYQLIARRIGFERASRFFSTTPEPMAIVMQLSRSVTRLDAMKVTADFSRRAAYRIGADQIASTDRPMFDGFDVLKTLGQRILSPSPRSKFNPCPTLYIWVNGRRIIYPPSNDRMEMELRGKFAVRSSTINPSAWTGRTPSPPNGIASMPLSVLSVLASIKAEHIDEINYSDCQDNSVPGTRTTNSVFVTLKPGVGYELARGSYVVDMPVTLAANRQRIVGVFDEATAQPIPGAEVRDSASASFVTTTETGTVTLAFLPDGEHVMWVRKKGYDELRFVVQISDHDMQPLTLTLSPRQ
jgi:hypothetical protein